MEQWQICLKEAITDPAELLAAVQLEALYDEKMAIACRDFPLRVPKGFVERMQKGNAKDPLLLQVLPMGIELQAWPGYTADPLQENCVNPARGLLHKYHGRVLLTLTGICAINCRYCFRRHFPYEANTPGLAGWEEAIAYIARDRSITEVILSGGDPLALKDDVLELFIARLRQIPHLTKLRLHTRLPVVVPERITLKFAEILEKSGFQTVVVLHVNHANEIDETVAQALNKMRRTHITLFSQAVLLRKINDSVVALRDLSERLFLCGVIPYYLHLLDKVQGAAHFAVNEEEARQLIWELMKILPGYLVPRLVREQAGAPSKIWVPIPSL